MERHSNRQSMSSTLCDDGFTPLTFCRCQSRTARILRALPWLLSCALGLSLVTLWARQSMVAQDQSSTFWKETEFCKEKPPSRPPHIQWKTSGMMFLMYSHDLQTQLKKKSPRSCTTLSFWRMSSTTQHNSRTVCRRSPNMLACHLSTLIKLGKSFWGVSFAKKSRKRGPIATVGLQSRQLLRFLSLRMS